MRATTIKADNFKGRTFNETLAPVTLFIGDNFAGKSARVEATILALAGYLPGVAVKPNEIHTRCASAPVMTVKAVLDDGRAITRTWADSKGKVTTEYEGVRGSDGLPFSLPPVAVDIEEFTSLSAAERVKFLLARAKLSERFSIAALRRTLATNAKNVKADTHTEAHETAVDRVVGEINTFAGDDPSAWLAGLVEHIRQLKLTTDASLKRMNQTQQGLTQVAAIDIPAANTEHKLEQAKKVYESHQTAHAQAKAAAYQADKALTEARALVETVQVGISDRMDVLHGKRSLLLAKPAPEPGPVDKVQQYLQTANNEWNRISLKVGEVQSNIAMMERDMEKNEAEITAAGNRKECPTCGQDTTEISKKLVAKLKADLKDSKTRLKALLDQEKTLKAEQEQIGKTLKDAEVKVNAWTLANSTHQQWSADLRQIQQQMDRLAEAEKVQQKAIDARDRLPALKVAADEADEKRRQAEETMNVAQAAMNAMTTEYKRLLAYRAEAATRAKAKAKADAAKAELEVLKKTQTMLAELQAEIVQEAVQPMVDRCNELCGDILPAPLAIVAGELGMERDGHFVTHRTMSGTEKLLAYCAVSMALAETAPIRLAVLEELGRLSTTNKVKVLNKICWLQAQGKLDQAILVDVGPLPQNWPPPANFAVVEI